MLRLVMVIALLVLAWLAVSPLLAVVVGRTIWHGQSGGPARPAGSPPLSAGRTGTSWTTRLPAS